MQAETGEQSALPGAQAAGRPAGPAALAGGGRSGPSLALGCAAGLVAAVVGAILWAAISYLTEYQIGWMAVGVGCLVGIAVRRFGNGSEAVFGILGGALALAGCLAGNLLTICLVLAREKAMPLLDVISRLDIGIVANLLEATFSPIDLLFYGIAVYEGYKLSLRPDAAAEQATTTA